MWIEKKIRAALTGRMRRMPGMGAVHPFERFSKDDKLFREMYVKDGRLLGWHIRRGRITERAFDSQVNRVRIKWQIRGLAAVVDGRASELALDSLVDGLRRAFRRTPLLRGPSGTIYARVATDEGAGFQVEDSGSAMFAGVLCHSVRLSLVTEHFEEIEPDVSAFAEVAGYDQSGRPLLPDEISGDPAAALCAGGHISIIAVER